MKRFLLTTAFLAAATGAAGAADLPAKAAPAPAPEVYNFTGFYAGGAGLYAYGAAASVVLTNSTVSANVDTSPNGTGAITTVRPSLTLANSIVSGNTNSSGLSPDINFINYSGSATFTASHSLIGVNYGTPLAPAPAGSPDAHGNLVGTYGSPLDARLGPLADNGEALLGHWSARGEPSEAITVLDGIKARAGADQHVLHAVMLGNIN